MLSRKNTEIRQVIWAERPTGFSLVACRSIRMAGRLEDEDPVH